MTASPHSSTLPGGFGRDLCRVTVQGPGTRCDLALPPSATLGEILPAVAGAPGAKPLEGAFVLQRLGGPPLDLGATAEEAGLLDGEILHLRPIENALPEVHYDDITTGVARSIAARADHWRPEYTTALTFAASLLVAGGFAVTVASLQPFWLRALWYALAASAFTVTALLPRYGSGAAGRSAGIAACGFGALAGVAAAGGSWQPGAALLISAGTGCAVPAAVLAGSIATGRSRLPPGLFGSVTALGCAGPVAGGLARDLHWDAPHSAAVLAVVVFALGRLEVRIVLRAVRLRVPQLPRNAAELQRDIEPVPGEVVAGQADQVAAALTILFVLASVLVGVAGVALSARRDVTSWALAVLLAVAVLLRSRTLSSVWHRIPLTAAGIVAAAAVAVAAVRTSDASSPLRALVPGLLLLAVIALAGAAGRTPGRGPLPVWGHLADLLEMWSAVALIPLLLLTFGVYARLRGLTG